MPVDTVHPQYKANIDRWTRCRDAYEGEDAVKAAGTAYLPRAAPDQTTEEYDAYRTRALYYEAVGRTIDGFVGAIARKPPEFKMAGALEIFEEDATTDGVGLPEFAKKLCAESLLIGRCGVLVDYDGDEDRAYLSVYIAESIVNWSPDSLVLQETVFERDPTDPFTQIPIVQYRQLHLDNGVYTVTLWRRKATNDQNVGDWIVYKTMTPTRRGQTFDHIPFFWLSSMGQTDRIEKPPMLGLVNVALSHYRSSADLEHGRHFTGLPTLYVTGLSPSQPAIRVGAASAILLTDPSAKAGYAEFSGQGLGSLENALEQKEQMMAVLGAFVFHDAKKGVEAAETAQIRTSGENSLLMGVVSAVEETLKDALQCAAEWMGISEAVEVTLNREFVNITMDPQTLLALVAAYQAGTMTLNTFLWNLQTADMLAPDTDIEKEIAAIRATPPAIPTNAVAKGNISQAT